MGTGNGVSVLELVKAFEKANEMRLPYVIGPRREGDLPAFWADASKAKELLSATAMRSSQIAAQVGYNDPHYFSYLFKKNTGMTPSEFRRSGGAGAE